MSKYTILYLKVDWMCQGANPVHCNNPVITSSIETSACLETIQHILNIPRAVKRSRFSPDDTGGFTYPWDVSSWPGDQNVCIVICVYIICVVKLCNPSVLWTAKLDADREYLVGSCLQTLKCCQRDCAESAITGLEEWCGYCIKRWLPVLLIIVSYNCAASEQRMICLMDMARLWLGI